MAIINNLALSMGGGIISLKQQAKQAENTVSILIGLGGTGVDLSLIHISEPRD